MVATPFDLLGHLYGDPATAEVWSERATVERWLQVEAALARAQADVGELDAGTADAIAAAATLDAIDFPSLWAQARNVGYPILPVVRAIAGRLPDGPNGKVHLGATTQDIMDTALALQAVATLDRLVELVDRAGELVERRMTEHERTVMAARTHGQQAVPTTFGTVLAPLLAEFARQRRRLVDQRPVVGVVSAYGAGGTSAAQGPAAPRVRGRLAELLGLGASDVPWHSARDSVAAFGAQCAAVAATCARLARAVIDLGRTEIGELGEAVGEHRGASSTMPQKANPIFAEAVVGMAAAAGPASAALYRGMEVPQERAAGEWHIEWHVLPTVAWLSAGCAATTVELLDGLRVDPEAMRRNLTADHGLVLSEAYMFGLTPTLGRERAHDLVYAAVRRVRRGDGGELPDAIRAEAAEQGITLGGTGDLDRIRPEDYVGEPERVCAAARSEWAAAGGPSAVDSVTG